MNKSLKFKQFLADIKQANPSLVESVLEAYSAVYESSEELVDDTKKALDDLGGSVPTEELTGLQKLPLRKQTATATAQAPDLEAQYMNFKQGSDKIPMRKADRSSMVDFIEYELEDKELADAFELVLRKSAMENPSMNKELKASFDDFIKERIDIDNFSDRVEELYNQLETSEGDTADYSESLKAEDTLNAAEKDTIGGVYNTKQTSNDNWW